MKLEINHRKKNGGKNDYTETKQHATEKKNNGSMMKSKRNTENTSRQMTMKSTTLKIIYGMQQKQF